MRECVLRSLGTHDGVFHADEVTACALLLLFQCIDRDKVIRTRDSLLLASCDYICDVGGIYQPENHLFDHHQVDYRGALSSAGMILLYLHERGKLSTALFDHLRSVLVKGVDDHDNGREPSVPGFCSYSHIITNFNPIRYNVSREEENKAFHNAVDFAFGHLERLCERYHYMLTCRALVEEQMARSSQYLLFEESIPWLESFFALGGECHPAKFLIMPSGLQWKLRGIPPSYKNRMKVRFPLPQEWAGLLDEELKQVSGISGAIFCHKGRFVSVWNSKEDAIKAMECTLALAEKL